jgi:hypothetical protein
LSRHGGCSWAVFAPVFVAVTTGSAAHAQSVGRLPDPSGSSASTPGSATTFPQPSSQPAAPAAPVSPDTSATRYPRDTSSWSSPRVWQDPAPAQSVAGSYVQPYAAAAPSVGGGSAGFYPAVLPYRDGHPVPAGYRLEERRNKGLSTGGFVTFGISYAAGLGYAVANSFEEGTGWLALPLVGPWAAIGAQEIKCQTPTVANPSVGNQCVEKALGGAERITFFTVDGLIQAVGLAMVFVGIGMKTTELVRNDVASVRLELKPRSVGVTGSF